MRFLAVFFVLLLSLSVAVEESGEYHWKNGAWHCVEDGKIGCGKSATDYALLKVIKDSKLQQGFTQLGEEVGKSDTGFTSRCKAVVKGAPTGGNECKVGCEGSFCEDLKQKVVNTLKCDGAGGEEVKCKWDGAANALAQFESSLTNNQNTDKDKEGADSNVQPQTVKSPLVPNDKTTMLCPDAAVTSSGFWVKTGEAGKGWAAFCQQWSDAAAESAEATYCHWFNDRRNVMCSKMVTAHPQKTPASVGTLMGKRMLCEGDVCSVSKVGLCIDVGTDVFVPEACAPGHKHHSRYKDSSACKKGGNVPNELLSDNVGIHATTIDSLGITNQKLDAKSMRIRWAGLATDLLMKKEKGSIKLADWNHKCTGDAAIRAKELLKMK